MVVFFAYILQRMEVDDYEKANCAFGNPSLSAEARTSVKQLLWEVRTHPDSGWMTRTWVGLCGLDEGIFEARKLSGIDN